MDDRRAPLTRAGRWALVAVPAAFLGVFFAWPVISIVVTGLRLDGGWNVDAFADVLTDGSTLDVIWFTVWQAALSTVVTLALGLPGAYVLSRLRFRGRTALRAAVTVPFVLPTVVVASAFLALAGPRGVLGERVNLQHTLWAILLAHAFFNYAVVVRTVGGLWAHIDPRLEEAARALGASRWRTFREVTAPLLRPAIAAAAAIVFLFTFTSFGVVVLLGGPRFATLEVEIVRSTRDLFDLPTASVLAVVQLVCVLALLAVHARLADRGTVPQPLRPAPAAAHPPSSAGERVFLGANLAVMTGLLFVPLAVLVERSLRSGDGYGLGAYRALSGVGERSPLFVPPVDAIANSLLYALAATAIALTVGIAAAFAVVRSDRTARGLDTLLMLPLGTSAVTVGFGLLITLDEPPLDLRSSWVLVPIAHALIAMPFVVRIVAPVLRAIDPRLREAAAVLGASPRRVWREIDIPIVARAAAVAAGFAFAVSLGEFGATLLIGRVGRPTMPVAIFRLLSQPGSANFAQAMAMSTILMIVTASVIIAIERFRSGNEAF